MKIKLTLVAVALLALCHFFSSCDDILQKDLSKQWVYVIAPQDFTVTTLVTPTLKWKEVKGAESYNLQISSTTDSTYLKIKEFVVDTNVRSTQYSCTLKPGFYIWEIVAQNNSSQSGLSRFHFQIDSTSDLSQQRVVLLTPLNNHTTDTLKQDFTWSPISAATNYNLQIYQVGNNIAILTVNTSAPTYTFTFPSAGGVYNWSVSAENKATRTPPGSAFKLTIDTASIPAPNLLSPVNDTTTVTGNYVSLKWGSVKNATSYYLQVTQNTSVSESQMDTLATIEKPLMTFCNFYYNNKGKAGTRYYWRVKAKQGTREGNFSNWVLFKRL